MDHYLVQCERCWGHGGLMESDMDCCPECGGHGQVCNVRDVRVDGMSFWDGFEAGEASRDREYADVLQALEMWWAEHSAVGEYLPVTAHALCRAYERVRPKPRG